MRRYHSWLAALGIAAATPGLALAGPLSLFTGDRDSQAASTPDAKAANTKQANDVAKALRSARLVGYDISVECRNGEVTLLGEVPTAQQRELASKVTGSVPGVRNVQNKLAVKQQGQVAKLKAKAPAAAPEMAARQVAPKRPAIQQVQFEEKNAAADLDDNQAKADEIADALRAARFAGSGVEIQFEKGVASISGSVGSVQGRNAATAIIRQIPGVQKVDNQLEVQAPVAARPMPTASRTAARQPARQPIRQVQYDQAMADGGQTGPRGQMGPGGQMMGPGGQMMGPGGPPSGNMGLPPIGPGGNGYPINPASAMTQGGPGPGPVNGMPMSAANPAMYDQPNLPQHAWPAYAAYPNYAAVSYPKQYSASAWPYIGPFYPYPQVPLGWRKVQLEWDDGYWQLNFRPRTERWWWFLNYQNW
jgi:osmotically-inducible protein OsmY